MGLGNQSQAGKLRVGRSCQKNLGKMDKTNWNRNKTSYTLGTQKEDSSCSYCSALKPGVGLRAPKSQPVKVVQALCQNICVLFLRLCPCWHVGPANPRAQLSRAVLCLQGCNFCVWLHWDFWREGGQESLALEQPSLKDCVLLPWKLVTETTCPGLPLHRSAEQMLKMRGDHLWASQRLLFNVHWICVLPSSSHKCPKQWLIFHLCSWMMPHDLLLRGISSYSATLYGSKLLNFTLTAPPPLLKEGDLQGELRGGSQAPTARAH